MDNAVIDRNICNTHWLYHSTCKINNVCFSTTIMSTFNYDNSMYMYVWLVSQIKIILGLLKGFCFTVNL